MLNAYFVDPVTLKTLTARDQWNEPTYQTTTVMAKIDRGTKLVRDNKGETVVAGALVYLPAALNITHDDTITIDGVERSIISIKKIYDFSFSHWEVSVT